MHVKSLIPKGWKEYKMRDLVKIDAKSLSNRTSGDYRFKYISLADVNRGMINDELNEHKFSDAPSRARRCVKKNDVLMATVRPNLEGFACIKKDVRDVIASTGFAVITPTIESDSDYLHQYLYSYEVRRQIYALVVGSNYPAINSTDVKKLKILAPTSPKTRALIGELLSTWDSAIEKIDGLIEAKEKRYKWLLNELINKGSKKNGWNNVQLGKLFEELTEKVGERDITSFSISAGIGFVSQKEKWGKDIAGKQYQNYVRLQKGEFAYNKGNSKKYTCGCAYLLKDNTEIAVPNVFISFKRKTKSICSEFYEHYFIADHHARELRKYISSSARSDGLLNLNKKDFFKILVPYPPAAKQKPIANALTTARQEIDLLKRLAEKYKEQKRGLMQKLLTGQWRVMVEKEKSQ